MGLFLFGTISRNPPLGIDIPNRNADVSDDGPHEMGWSRMHRLRDKLAKLRTQVRLLTVLWLLLKLKHPSVTTDLTINIMFSSDSDPNTSNLH